MLLLVQPLLWRVIDAQLALGTLDREVRGEFTRALLFGPEAAPTVAGSDGRDLGGGLDSTLLGKWRSQLKVTATGRWFLPLLMMADRSTTFGTKLRSRCGFSRSPFRFQEWPSNPGWFWWWEQGLVGWGKCCKSSFLSELHEPEQSGSGLWSSVC